MSDINMTPLIDVMLVLLVIFMITAPLMSGGLQLDLPKVDTAAQNDTQSYLSVAMTHDGNLYFGEEKLSAETFNARVTSVAKRSPDIEVHLRADEHTPYGLVAALIGGLQEAGLTRIALVTESSAAGAAETVPSANR